VDVGIDEGRKEGEVLGIDDVMLRAFNKIVDGFAVQSLDVSDLYHRNNLNDARIMN
jgi:hypothetical protein